MLVGLAIAVSGRLFGLGIAVGAVMAVLNSTFLIKRVQFAVDSPSAAVATVSMQVGLLLTFGVIGLVTLLLLVLSVQMAVAMGITFFAVQTGEIVLYYLGHSGRPAGGGARLVGRR